jgi:hypothetical protein
VRWAFPASRPRDVDPLSFPPDVEIAPPAAKPAPDTRGLKRGGEVTLEKPILRY